MEKINQSKVKRTQHSIMTVAEYDVKADWKQHMHKSNQEFIKSCK